MKGQSEKEIEKVLELEKRRQEIAHRNEMKMQQQREKEQQII